MKYVRRNALMLIFILCGAPLLAQKPETPHLVFVTEYVRELAAVEDIRASAEQENEKAEDNNAKFLDAIHSSTRFQLELRTQIRTLGKMHLNPPFDTLIPNIANLYEEKVKLYQELIDICTVMLAGPKPEVDYGKLAAEMPKARAKLEYIDETLLYATAAITYLLVDQRPDSQNHLSHLIITKAERAKLLSDLNSDFGDKLNQPNQNYTVSAAKLLNDLLLKDYKCSDDPWDNNSQVEPSGKPKNEMVPSGVAQGMLVHRVAPQYPAQAKQAHVQGTVVLQAVIGKDGSVTSVTALRGDPILTQAAIDAVRQWRYKPYYLNGEPVEVDTQISVTFSPQ
jgi:TonB family protein